VSGQLVGRQRHGCAHHGLGLSATFPTGTLHHQTKLGSHGMRPSTGGWSRSLRIERGTDHRALARVHWHADVPWIPDGVELPRVDVFPLVGLSTDQAVTPGSTAGAPRPRRTMLRIPVTFRRVCDLGAVVSDDTGHWLDEQHDPHVKGTGGWFHAATGQSYTPHRRIRSRGLLRAPVVPYAPVWSSPLNNAAAPFAGGGTFDWKQNPHLPEAGDAQVPTTWLSHHGPVSLVDGSALTTAQSGATRGNEVAVTSATTSATIGASSCDGWWCGRQVTGHQMVSGSRTSWILNCGAARPVPSLSATYDSANNA